MNDHMQYEEIAQLRFVMRRAVILFGTIASVVFVAPIRVDRGLFVFVLHASSAAMFAGFFSAALSEFVFDSRRVTLALLWLSAMISTGPYIIVAGIGTAETAWLPMLAVVGCLVGGIRYGFWWAMGAVVIAVASAVGGAQPHEGPVFDYYQLANARVYYGVVAVLLITFAVVGYGVMEHYYNRSNSRVSHANAHLEEAVATLEITLRERDELRQRLVESQKLESLGLMAGGLAHDFNNLLTGIMGELDIAAHDARQGEDVQESIEFAKESALAASEMTEALLSYAGRKPVKRSAIDPIDVSDLVRSIAATATGRAVPIVVDAVEGERSFIGDRGQVEQVLLNLVLNAVQACDDLDEPEVVVSIKEKLLSNAEIRGNRALTELEPGQYVIVEVADNGVGMDDEALQRIFEPFFTSKASGRGLGLAAALGIVRAHKGGMFVESTPGMGTTFKVAFPAIARDSELPARPDTMRIRTNGAVLIVDDRPEVSTALGRLVESLGLDAVVESSGTAALELFKLTPKLFDVALIDVMMPELRGDRLAEMLREVRPDLPVIFMSGYVGEEGLLDRVSCAHFLPKPIRRADLERVLVPTVQAATGRFQQVKAVT